MVKKTTIKRDLEVPGEATETAEPARPARAEKQRRYLIEIAEKLDVEVLASSEMWGRATTLR